LNFLNKKLEERKESGLFRELRHVENCIDFTSNDYLGFARSSKLEKRIDAAWQAYARKKSGATGSRLLSGNSALAEELEQQIAAFHEAETALLFNSGYDANVGLFSCLAGRADTILYDELVHASIRDGARLCLAKKYSFRHNDIADLESKIQKATGDIFIAVESVYSMDGDTSPLQEIIQLKKRHGNLHIIVDEAHATGIYGPQGKGIASETGIRGEIFARVYTFGKALGMHGAAVVGSAELRTYLVNFARPFIYSTALPPHALISIREGYNLLPVAGEERTQLQNVIKTFTNAAKERLPGKLQRSCTAIQSVIISGNENAKSVAKNLQEKGFDVRPILSPTVSAGTERIRICLHAYNTEVEVNDLVNELAKLL
jgi:8-amino-7-oxononanoate synthase